MGVFPFSTHSAPVIGNLGPLLHALMSHLLFQNRIILKSLVYNKLYVGLGKNVLQPSAKMTVEFG